MSCRATVLLPSITARPSPAEKARFAQLAEHAGMSESALALVAIRSMLDPDSKMPLATVGAAGSERIRATDRITIRLRPGDGAAITRRAGERGMKASTYLAAPARAHVRANPPLPTPELAALKQSVVVAAGLGTVLTRIARNPALCEPALEELRQNLARMRVIVADLEQRTHDFIRAALIAWESSSG
jgi:hypothetical protein